MFPARGRAQGPGWEGSSPPLPQAGCRSRGAGEPSGARAQGRNEAQAGGRPPAGPEGPGPCDPRPISADPALPAEAAGGSRAAPAHEPGTPGSLGARNGQDTARFVSSPALVPPSPGASEPNPIASRPARWRPRPRGPNSPAAGALTPPLPLPHAQGRAERRSGSPAPRQARPDRGAKRELPAPAGRGAAVSVGAAGPGAGRSPQRRAAGGGPGATNSNVRILRANRP